MGRTKTKPKGKKSKLKPIVLSPGKHWCSACKISVSKNKGGVEKHKASSKHRQNVQKTVSITNPRPKGHYYCAGSLASSSGDGSEFDDEPLDKVDATQGLDLIEGYEMPVEFPNDIEMYQPDEPYDMVIEPEANEAAPNDGFIYVDAPPEPPLDPTKIYVQRHPHHRTHPPTVPDPPKPSQTSYWPFKTQEDFELAELCIDAGLPTKTIDNLVNLFHRVQSQPGSITLKNAKQMNETMDNAAQFKEDRFEVRTVTTKFNGIKYKHTLHVRNIDTVIRELLADPEFNDVLTFEPECRYIARPDGGRMRVYQEYNHSNDMWEIRTNMGPQTKPIIIMAYADATQISSFGNVSVWAVYIALGNLPHRVRGSHGKGGYKLIAFLPTGVQPPTITKGQLADFRNTLYHNCWRIILDPIKDDARVGNVYQLGNGEQMNGTPIVPLFLADYEEACRMNGNIGFKGPCGCVVCLQPSESFDVVDRRWPLRDSVIATRSIEKARRPPPSEDEGDDGDDDEIPTPKKLGIRPVENAFNPVTNHFFSIPRANGADGLHVYFVGEYGKHAVPDVLATFSEGIFGKLNLGFMSLPGYPGLKHYAKGITSLKWKSGADYKVIAKVLPPILNVILPRDIDNRTKILQLFRLFGECAILLGFTTHTDITLEKFRSVLERMAVLQKALEEQFGFNHNIPKFHMLHMHFLDSIRDKGPICNTDTSYGEACHPQSKKDYKLTNLQPEKFEIQMLQRALRRQALVRIRGILDAENDEEKQPSSEDVAFSHVTVGSNGSRSTIRRLLASIRIPDGLAQPVTATLISGLQHLLYNLVDNYKDPGRVRPRPEDLPKVDYLKIIEHKFARINYVSLQDSSDGTDIIRVTPEWRKKDPRYDFVLINLDYRTLSCAQVHLLFTIETPGGKIQVALIRILKSLVRNPTTGYIHASESTEYKFVSTRCFVRSIFVHPPTPPSMPRYVLNDLIDADMYIRLQNQ